MLDAPIRPLISPPLGYLGSHFAKRGIPANSITVLGFLSGIAAVPLIIGGHKVLPPLVLKEAP